MKKRVLFICKHRSTYGVSYGLINSARFVADALVKCGIEAKVIDVIDNNCIDREVTKYKPTHVVIEALWVVPEKFPILLKLHPSVEWQVRLHSRPVFLGNEGIAFKLLHEYAKLSKANHKFKITANTQEVVDYLDLVLGVKTYYTPNIYLNYKRQRSKGERPGEIDIGCFGAVRPLKNHIPQALAAIAFAKKLGKKLFFHINGDRIEQRGDEAFKNLRSLFEGTPNAQLVEHPWMPHAEFLQVVQSMDIVMQATLSETFNIVGADIASFGIPLVACSHITWASCLGKVDPLYVKSIERGLNRVWKFKWLTKHLTWWGMKRWNKHAIKAWKKLVLCTADV